MKNKNSSMETKTNKKNKKDTDDSKKRASNHDDNDKLKKQLTIPSDSKTEIESDLETQVMSIDENQENEESISELDDNTLYEELMWINSLVHENDSDEIIEQYVIQQNASILQVDDLSFDPLFMQQNSSVLQLDDVNFNTLFHTSLTSSDLSSAKLKKNIHDFLQNMWQRIVNPGQSWTSLSSNEKEAYKAKLHSICQSPEALVQNTLWVYFFYEVLTFSLTRQLKMINQELFNLEDYLTLAVHLKKIAFKNQSWTEEQTQKAAFLSLKAVFYASREVIDVVMLAKPQGNWQHLAFPSWIKFYIHCMSKDNILSAMRPLLLSKSPIIIKLVEGEPNFIDAYANAINTENALAAFASVLLTRNPTFINKILSSNPYILNFLAEKITKDNILELMRYILLSRNSKLFQEFIKLGIIFDNKRMTALNFYLSNLAQNNVPSQTIKSIQSVLQTYTREFIETIFTPSEFFKEGLLSFYLELNVEQRQANIKRVFSSRNVSLIEQCITQTCSWTDGKTILAFYIRSLKEPDSDTPANEHPETVLTQLFHARQPNLNKILAHLKMPAWAGDKSVLDYYFARMKDDLSTLITKIFRSKDNDFIKLCLEKKLYWLENAPSLGNFYINSLTEETALIKYVEATLTSHSPDYILGIMLSSVPWNKQVNILHWYLSSSENFRTRMIRIFKSYCPALIDEIAGKSDNNNSPNYVYPFLGLIPPFSANDAPVSNLNFETLLSHLHIILSSRNSTVSNWLVQEEKFTGTQSLFCYLLAPYWAQFQNALQLEIEWSKILTKLINLQNVSVKNKLFSELLGTISLNLNWIDLLFNRYEDHINKTHKSWLPVFLEAFISERKKTCMQCIELLEKDSQDNCVINLSDHEIKQTKELLNSFNNPCFTITSSNNQHHLQLISKEDCNKLKQELLCFPLSTRTIMSTDQKILKEILIQILHTEDNICKVKRMAEATVKEFNKVYKKYFLIRSQGTISKVTIVDRLVCLELAKKLNISPNEQIQPFLPPVKLAYKQKKSAKKEKVLQEILTKITENPPHVKHVSYDGSYPAARVNQLNKEYASYFIIENKSKAKQIHITVVDSLACLMLASKIEPPNHQSDITQEQPLIPLSGSTSDDFNFMAPIENQAPKVAFTITELNTIASTPYDLSIISSIGTTHKSPIPNSSEPSSNDLKTIEPIMPKSDQTLDSYTCEQPKKTVVTSNDKPVKKEKKSISQMKLIQQLNYVLSLIKNNHIADTIQLTKEELCNIKHRAELNKHYKHCFLIKPTSLKIEIISHDECLKLINNFNVKNKHATPETLQSLPQAKSSPTITTTSVRSNKFRFQFASTNNNQVTTTQMPVLPAQNKPN